MALCLNQSGVWKYSSQPWYWCSGAWRSPANNSVGCENINVAGTWRCYGYRPPVVSNFSMCQNPAAPAGAPTNIIYRSGSGTSGPLYLCWSVTNATCNTGTNVTLNNTSCCLAVDPVATTTYCGKWCNASTNATGTCNSVSCSVTLNCCTPTGGVYFAGGNLVYRQSGVNWIAAPTSSEAGSITWANRGTATSQAQSLTGCTGWFIPTCASWVCLTFLRAGNWQLGTKSFWTDTECSASFAWVGVACPTNQTGCVTHTFKTLSNMYARAFRCVTY